MTTTSSTVLRWAPRLLCIAFISFVSLFALDVFNEGHGFWRTVADLAMHLIPSFIMIGMLAAAWRREWIGTILFIVAGAFFLAIGRGIWVKALFAAPAFLAAGLFLAAWRDRKRRVSAP